MRKTPESRKSPKRSDDVFDFDSLSAAEKERFYEDCEKIVPGEGQPLTQSQRALHARIGSKARRPRVGKGSARVNVTVERGLLVAADRYAKRNGMTRSELIAMGLKTFIRI